jgi:type I restriction enzyme S subunit
VEVEDTVVYKRCRVQLHAQGIVLRDLVLGADVKTKRQQICTAGDFLVAEIDAKVGGFGIVPPELEGAIVSSHYFLFDIDTSLLDPRYLGHFLRTPSFTEQVKAQGSTNYAAVRSSDVLRYVIPLPSIGEQRRLADRLDRLAELTARAEYLSSTSAAAAQALVRAALKNCFATNGDSNVLNLHEVCSDIIDNLHSNPEYADDGVPCVRSPDVGVGTLKLATALRTSEMEYLHRTVRGEPAVGDIVFVREGGGTGKAALVEEGQRFSLGQRVMMLRPNPLVILPRFLLYQILSPNIYDEQVVPRLGGSASPHLNIGVLRQFHVVVPDLSKQQRVVEYLERLFQKTNLLASIQQERDLSIAALMPSALHTVFM